MGCDKLKDEDLFSLPVDEILAKYPFAVDFFHSCGLQKISGRIGLTKWLSELEPEYWEDSGISQEQFLSNFRSFIQEMLAHEKASALKIDTITVLGGKDKSGYPENTILVLKSGQIVSIVGPTGSGKSRLLSDIECLAQGDTPTQRKILLNGAPPDQNQRVSLEQKIVAQISQNMNFVVDLTVDEFVKMHAESRMIPGAPGTVRDVIACANELAGEKFSPEVPVTQLSGGQSRALMIADTALLSGSPIILIDEIENAGVDRKKALELLVRKGKIVLMSTHDPLLALMGERRVVIQNGGIRQIIETSELERENMKLLQKMDAKMMELRGKLRNGQRIEFDLRPYLALVMGNFEDEAEKPLVKN
jgi:ABC-type lipoprotein export system ATPase subunit